MDSLSEFLAMGGHGGFVWPAFGIAIGILLVMAIHAWLQRRRLRQKLAALQATGTAKRSGA